MKLVVIKYKDDIMFKETHEFLLLKGKYSHGIFNLSNNYLTVFKR